MGLNRNGSGCVPKHFQNFGAVVKMLQKCCWNWRDVSSTLCPMNKGGKADHHVFSVDRVCSKTRGAKPDSWTSHWGSGGGVRDFWPSTGLDAAGTRKRAKKCKSHCVGIVPGKNLRQKPRKLFDLFFKFSLFSMKPVQPGFARLGSPCPGAGSPGLNNQCMWT